MNMGLAVRASVVCHADWGSNLKKRWCAKAILDGDGRYTAFAPELAGQPGMLLSKLHVAAGHTGCALVGFDFPIGLPAAYAKRAGVSSFRDLLPRLGQGNWKDFYSVCDEIDRISIRRPFYPNGHYKGRRREDLFRRHGVDSFDQLLRRCERGGKGRRQACCLFWTLGSSQVGKAAISGWRDVLAPALRDRSLALWPFDGPLSSLLRPGRVAVAETYPGENYGWFEGKLRSKGDQAERRKFGKSLREWADTQAVKLDDQLSNDIRIGFPQGDDAFNATVGLLGMLQVCLGQRATGEPNEPEIRDIEGWILGRKS